MNKIIYKSIIKKSDDESRIINAVISTEDVDHDGEVVVQEGIDTSEYQSSPIVLDRHNPDKHPVGKVISLNTKGGVTTASIQFTSKEENPDGYQTYRLYKGGYQTAFSVGLLPKEDDWRDGVRYLTKTVLKEISTVPFGSNPQAVAKAYKDGIITKQQMEEHLVYKTSDKKDFVKKSEYDNCNSMKSNQETDYQALYEKEVAKNGDLLEMVKGLTITVKHLTTKSDDEDSDTTDTDDSTEEDSDKGEKTESKEDSGNEEDVVFESEEEKEAVFDAIKKRYSVKGDK